MDGIYISLEIIRHSLLTNRFLTTLLMIRPSSHRDFGSLALANYQRGRLTRSNGKKRLVTPIPLSTLDTKPRSSLSSPSKLDKAATILWPALESGSVRRNA